MMMKTKMMMQLLLLVTMMLLKHAWSFDFYALALQWPAGVCRQSRLRNPCRPMIPTKFTVHGYWPTNRRPPPPFSHGPKHSAQDLQTNMTNSNVPALVTAMATDWPQLFASRTDWSFWSHEWDDHGRYTTLTPSQYFQEAINAYNSYNPLTSLRAAGIVPDNIRVRRTGFFKKTVGGNSTLVCYRNPVAGNFILTEIRSCYDNNPTPTRITCTTSDITTCGGEFGDLLFILRP